MLSGAVLSREEIERLIASERPLVRDFADLGQQLQPNGFDLTLAAIERHSGAGTIGVDNADRVLPNLTEMTPDDRGFFHLEPGPYHITYAETVALPEDLMALGRPRSSLTRSGVAIHTAVWDAGYEGRSTSLLVVSNPAGFRVQLGARVAQLVFVRLSAATEQGYAGIYQGENQPNR
ncbi:MAG: deoxyuridine 5'-triphosphate nucleotidohydrolase [Thermomicrobiales bacterium]|nr:deoxyuridine 5'-triphosphate nucleotidohydrolase [Thermomicrobiales bacterium]